MKSTFPNRRVKRSTERPEALQFLVENLADRAGVPALVLVDERGRILAGLGMPEDVLGLAWVAGEVGQRRATPAAVNAATRGRDVTARSFAVEDRLLTFAALCERMTGLGDAVHAARRILRFA